MVRLGYLVLVPPLKRHLLQLVAGVYCLLSYYLTLCNIIVQRPRLLHYFIISLLHFFTTPGPVRRTTPQLPLLHVSHPLLKSIPSQSPSSRNKNPTPSLTEPLSIPPFRRKVITTMLWPTQLSQNPCIIL